MERCSKTHDCEEMKRLSAKKLLKFVDIKPTCDQAVIFILKFSSKISFLPLSCSFLVFFMANVPVIPG